MKPLTWLSPLILMLLPAAYALADSTDAACAVYPRGEDHTDVVMPCTFSQRQGYVTIRRADGVEHDLSPSGDAVGVFTDAAGESVYRQSGLGDQGLIFRFPTESVYVYWSTSMLEGPDAVEGLDVNCAPQPLSASAAPCTGHENTGLPL